MWMDEVMDGSMLEDRVWVSWDVAELCAEIDGDAWIVYDGMMVVHWWRKYRKRQSVLSSNDFEYADI